MPTLPYVIKIFHNLTCFANVQTIFNMVCCNGDHIKQVQNQCNKITNAVSGEKYFLAGSALFTAIKLSFSVKWSSSQHGNAFFSFFFLNLQRYNNGVFKPSPQIRDNFVWFTI